MSDAKPRIGFIGTGVMGSRMARNLQAAGYPLVVTDVRKAAAESLVANGASWVGTPAQIAQSTDVIMISLPGPPQVEEVVFGSDGLATALREGHIAFDLSTNSLGMVRRAGMAFAEKGAFFFDAPISGGVKGAQDANLAIWVGGDKAVYVRSKPILDAIGSHVNHLGDIGSGTITKLATNCASYSILCAIAEVYALGVKAGVDPLTLWEAMRQGGVGRRRTFDGLIDQFLPNEYEPVAFGLPLAYKDVLLATDLGKDLGVPMRIANLALADLTEAVNKGWSDKDARIVMLLQQLRSGVEIQVDRIRIREVLDRDPPAKGDPKALMA